MTVSQAVMHTYATRPDISAGEPDLMVTGSRFSVQATSGWTTAACHPAQMD